MLSHPYRETRFVFSLIFLFYASRTYTSPVLVIEVFNFLKIKHGLYLVNAELTDAVIFMYGYISRGIGWETPLVVVP